MEENHVYIAVYWIVQCSFNTTISDGGCTESFPVSVTTDPDVPDGQVPPRGVAVSQSIISLIWQPPAEPNGPNIRYELSRQKTNEPLNCT